MRTYFYLVFIVAAFSCSVPQASKQDRDQPLPKQFSSNTDTSSSAELLHRAVFTSPQLGALIDTVVKNNYDMRIAAQRIRAAQAQVRQASGLLRPMASAAAIPSIRKFGLYTMDGAGNAVTDMKPGEVVPEHLPDFFFGAQASWEVDLWGKLKNRKKAAAARFFATSEGRNLVLTNLVAETIMAYYELVAADHELKVLNQTIDLQVQALELVRVQKEAAVVNELAVQQFEAQLLNMQSMRSMILQDIARTETRINSLAGKYYQPVARDTAFFDQKVLPLIRQGLPSALLRNRPDIRQAEWELVAAKADLSAARALFYPALNIGASIGVQGYQPSILFRLPESLAYTLIGGLTAPILNRSMIKGEFQKADAMQLDALYNYQKILVRSYNEVYEEMSNIRNLSDVFRFKQKETSTLYGSIQVSAELFRTGRADYLEVLLTRQNALRTNMELINTRKQQFFAAVNLYKALGGGWQQ